MISSRKKPGMAFWATVVAVGVNGLYFAAAGPVNLMIDRGLMPKWLFTMCATIYRPLSWLIENGPEPIRRALLWYFSFWQ